MKNSIILMYLFLNKKFISLSDMIMLEIVMVFKGFGNSISIIYTRQLETIMSEISIMSERGLIALCEVISREYDGGKTLVKVAFEDPTFPDKIVLGDNIATSQGVIRLDQFVFRVLRELGLPPGNLYAEPNSKKPEEGSPYSRFLVYEPDP